MPNPTYAKVQEGARIVRENDIDFILTVGDGSVIDCCKIVSAQARMDEDVWDAWYTDHRLPTDFGPIGAVVMASGAGAEQNNGAVITHEEKKLKQPLFGAYHSFAVLDSDLRPGVANLPDAETIAQYDTIFVGSPCWWHQPAMVVCTFLEACDLKGKVIVPFITYGATTYLNETIQKIYRLTSGSKHIPDTLTEDLNPDDITTPGPTDDADIDMPGNARGTEAWLRRIGVIR